MARGGSKPSAASKKTANASKNPTGRTADTTKKAWEEGSVSLDLQQKCLDVFRDALKPSGDDSAILQEVKGHLFNRDFATAFGTEEYLRVYASRWSPSRALAYLNIFTDMTNQIQSTPDDTEPAHGGGCMRVVCLGGGAGGELVGLGGWLSALSAGNQSAEKQRLHVDLVDITDWTAVVQVLQTGLTTPPELSKYASQAKKDANKPLVPEVAFGVEFHRLDVLSSEKAEQDRLAVLLEKADLVTFMFTLNELYTASLPATKLSLDRITNTMNAGSHFLVVDSPGSYSTVSLNGTEKKYPMMWLLDHTLLGSGNGSDKDEKWEKLVEHEGRWFRLSEESKYPIGLEDMRSQMHLYKKV